MTSVKERVRRLVAVLSLEGLSPVHAAEFITTEINDSLPAAQHVHIDDVAMALEQLRGVH